MNLGALKIRKPLFGVVLATAAAVLVVYLIIFFVSLDMAMYSRPVDFYDLQNFLSALNVVRWIALIANIISSVALCIVSGTNRLPMTAGVSCAVMTLIEVIFILIPIPDSGGEAYSIVFFIVIAAISITEIIIGIVNLAKKVPVNNMYGGMYGQQPAQMPFNNGMYAQQPTQMPSNNGMYGQQPAQMPTNNGMYAQQPAQMPANNGMYGQQPAQMPTNNGMYAQQPTQMPTNNGMYGQSAQMPTGNGMYGNQAENNSIDSNNSDNSNNMQ